MDSGDLNPNPYAWTANTLPSELNLIFLLKLAYKIQASSCMDFHINLVLVGPFPNDLLFPISLRRIKIKKL